MTAEFNPILCQCTICLTPLKSAYQGHFVECECGESFVDQTAYYSRYGGSVKSVSELILNDLKALTGIGYEKDDIVDYIKKKFPNSLPEYVYYIPCSSLGGSSFSELVIAGRGHKVLEYLESLREGY
jgi:hypothetical protein